jgi:light-regulated signal transduction histidine kinase (bacteriophytochrome)
VGFEMKYVHKIFAVFQRLHHEREFQGTGIGLAIVKKIIDRHNGRVWAESTIDVGTKVCFSIPKTRAAVAKNLVRHTKQ